MPHYTLHIDGEEWTVGSKEAPYDATHAVAGALLAGAEEITIERRAQLGYLHSDEDVRERIDELREMLSHGDNETADTELSPEDIGDVGGDGQ